MNELDLFAAAIAITDSGERAALLDRECAGQSELRGRIEQLLEAHFRSHPLLDAVTAPTRSDAGPGVATKSYHPSEAANAIIAGRYTLVDVVGEGGMGSVWRAKQTEPVKRFVAVKLIRVERGQSKTILARFEAERQAIALMDHPHIAKLLDAGTTDDGAPFFVMELVKGVPLNDYCDQHRLTIPERLTLFTQICSAVQHAHQKGIIHRDLKPSNILVESHDGKPVPKVIDFGLAKATTGLQISEQSMHTAFGSVMGTPTYMAPEQASFNAIDIDTRADIYSLGVILYELLTGTTPITRETLKKAALDEMLRLIREQEAPTPSSRLSSSESRPSVAANRQLEPAKLGRFVRGELDWIVMKALSKERDRRYETANGFAKDIERFLNHEPVVAGPPSARYRMRKFVQRHRVQVTAASLVLGALLLGIVGTTWGLLEARRQEAEAKRQEGLARNEAFARERARQAEAMERRKAEVKEAEANAVVTFFEEQVFAAARPKGRDGGLGADVTLRNAIMASAPALAKSFMAQPLVEARLRMTLGITFLYLAEHDEARSQFERSRALYACHLGPDHAYTLKCMNNLAVSYQGLNRQADALKLREEVLAIQRRVLPRDHPDTLMSMTNLANSYAEVNRPAEALKLREEVLAMHKRVLPQDHPETLMCMNNLASSYAALNRQEEALKLREEALAIQKRVLLQDHPDMLRTMTGLANSYAALNRPIEALMLREHVLLIQKRVLPQDHPDTLISMNNLAVSYAGLDRQHEALKLREEVLEIMRRVLPQDHPQTLTSMNNLAISYADLNRQHEALKLREEVLEIQKRMLPQDHPEMLVSMSNLATSYAALNRPKEALTLREAVLEIQKRVLPQDHPETLRSMVNLAASLIEANRTTEALALIDEFLAKGNWPGVDPRVVPFAIGLRKTLFSKAGDPVGCRTTAEMWENLCRTDAHSLFGAACLRAITAAVQAKTPGADAAQLAQADADKAMAWLQLAVKAGWTDAAQIKAGTELDALRDREDFKKLLAEVEAKAATKP
ncbi:MAG TPA: serine/threonine-protein kinase [Gemmatales bacterium]|nr:serine/threonine-protein kinase [Gemmatales bacterium]